MVVGIQPLWCHGLCAAPGQALKERLSEEGARQVARLAGSWLALVGPRLGGGGALLLALG
jgi:hypothetical protein